MAGTPLDSSRTSTPPGAVSPEDSVRTHDEHMDETDPQATRKRPRLDSGSASREAMSTGESPVRRSASPTTSNPEEPPSLYRSASRVTINMVSPSRPVGGTDGQSDGPSGENGMLSDVANDAADQLEDTTMVGAQSSTAISISSSPLRSPEIEVADLEDMDQDPNTSNWRPLGEAFRDQGVAEVVQVHEQLSLADSFPKIRGNLDLRESVEEIVTMIEKGHPHDVVIFVTVKQWLALCARNLNQITYESLLDDRDFWEELPTIIEGLLRRTITLTPSQGHGTWQSFEEFFMDFGQLALHMLHLDSAGLCSIPDDPDIQVPDSVAKTYLPSLGWILQIYNIPFFRVLARLNHVEFANLIARVSDRLSDVPVNALERISEFASRAFPLLPRFPHLAHILISALNVAHNLVQSGTERRNHDAGDEYLDTPVLIRTIKSAYQLFRIVDEKFQTHVSKKSSWVTSEVSEPLLRYIGNVYQMYGALDPNLLSRLARDLSLELPPDTKPEESSTIAFYAWRFGALKRHIMEGRMELRVFGMETMQADLVNIWRQYIQSNPEGIGHPVIQCLIKFLRDNRLIDYIVGVGSHPQLISRSGNIVGFLVVTCTYTDADTDTIWKAVTDSQDQRTVSEVLTMLIRTFVMHPASSTALLYLCSKLLELPLSRFDPRMLDFCDQLFNGLRDKHGERHRTDAMDIMHVDALPLRLCVRLIRESTLCDDLSTEHKTNLQRFASVQLTSFLNLGISEIDKLDVYERCIQDIADRNEFASGSIQALNALLPGYDSQEIRKLATDFELTALVIMELVHFWEANQSDFSDMFSKNALLSRIQLLNRIIDKVPDTITPELSDILWTKVFMTEKMEFASGLLWEMLCRATGHSGTQNPFIERCLHQYLPELSPEKYSREVLSFAEQAVGYEIRFNPPSVPAEDEVMDLPGMDRIWHFILTAPPGTIENMATRFAIDVYLDHTLIRRAPVSAAEATHISLVGRCVEQIKSAATKLKTFCSCTSSGEDEPMISVADDIEIRAEGLRLSRSLLFLQQLLQGLRSRPQYSPRQGQAPELPERFGKGDPVEISYQTFSTGSQSKVRTLQIGGLCTAAELVDRLTRVTGFSKFTAIYGGQKINLLDNPDTTVQDLKFKGLLIIRKISDGLSFSTVGRRQSLTLVDSEVLKHFEDLYDLLDLEDAYAREIYDFLVCFPPQELVRQLVKDTAKREEDIFPMRKPYKLLYSVQALSACLREESLESEPNEAFISHSVRILVAALIRPQMQTISDNDLKLVFAYRLVECLLSALLVKAETHPTLPDPELLVKQLLNFLELARNSTDSQLTDTNTQKIICYSFAVLIEASVHDHSFWDVTKNHAQFEHLILSLLLQEHRQPIRREIAENIKVICGPSKSQKKAPRSEAKDVEGKEQSDNPIALDIIATIWTAFVRNMRHTVEYAEQSREFLAVALAVFRSVAERSPHDVIFAEYLFQWSETMLSHETEEYVGREPVDYVILGFARLLRLCLEIADQTDTPISAPSLIERLFSNYLFPDLSEHSEKEKITPRIPVMHEETREELYNILVLLCKQVENYAKVIELISDLIPHDYTYSSSWTTDRLKIIRSPEGYAGLKNLSNTCYLNSLFTQLFMNVGFREFMLQLPVTEPESSQKLLAETKKIFGNMQETWCKFVDPEGAVGSIRTYDNEPIDVTIQMDVDEFYNLLFDRWEAQIVDPEEKKRFRAFYGGQLVQQIKSKECEHISERLEPFSAIQCDIKGKLNLEESLQAYVEGETMQGDNKYSCTSCGRHVDAVKRACLKDLPDNLIFHLKRFDFDMVSMMRSKINDEFQFPERIDMTPYKVEYLSNPSGQFEPDIFELVGVLVHSGTAESGHYYSYIRERPVAGSKKSWVEFNDADVNSFDPSKIAEQCFGGLSDPPMVQTRYGKVWNAYMLFYQRVTNMEAAKEMYQPSTKDVPVHVKLPIDLGNHIAMENELFIRTFCLLDPYHASFVRYLVTLSREFVSSGAPNAHKLQKLAIFIGLDTLDQLISRTRENIPELERYLTEFSKTIHETPKGGLKIIQWVGERETGVRNLILKSTQGPVRSVSMKILLMALAKIQDLTRDETLSQAEQERWKLRYTECFEEVVATLEKLWPILHTASRAWDDYFEFLTVLTTFAVSHLDLLLDHGFLLKCLEIIWLDREDSKRLKRQYALYYRNIERGRKYSHRKLFELLANLMKYIDFTLPPTADEEPRTVHDGRFSLNETESSFIRTIGRSKDLVFVRKILQQHSNPGACRVIVGFLLDAEPDNGLLEPIVKVFEDGLRVAPAALCAPFLEATLTFCKRSPDEEHVVALIDYVAKGVDSINNSGGKEHLGFLTNLLSYSNERIEKDERWFETLVVERIPDWAPTLLLYADKTVRNLTFDLLREILFNKEQEEQNEEARVFYVKIAKELAQMCVDRLRKTYLATPGQNIETKVIESINIVITHCLEAYYDESEEEDADFMQQAAAVQSAIEELAVDLPEEMASESDFASPEDWEDNSIMGSDSELGMTGTP